MPDFGFATVKHPLASGPVTVPMPAGALLSVTVGAFGQALPAQSAVPPEGVAFSRNDSPQGTTQLPLASRSLGWQVALAHSRVTPKPVTQIRRCRHCAGFVFDKTAGHPASFGVVLTVMVAHGLFGQGPLLV